MPKCEILPEEVQEAIETIRAYCNKRIGMAPCMNCPLRNWCGYEPFAWPRGDKV